MLKPSTDKLRLKPSGWSRGGGFPDSPLFNSIVKKQTQKSEPDLLFRHTPVCNEKNFSHSSKTGLTLLPSAPQIILPSRDPAKGPAIPLASLLSCRKIKRPFRFRGFLSVFTILGVPMK